MPKSARTEPEKLGPKRFLALLGSRHSLDWWVFLLFCIPAIEAQAIFDSGRLGGSVVDWLSVAIAALSISAAVWALARVVWLRGQEKINPYLVLIFFMAVGFIRGYALHVFAHANGLEDDGQLAYRYVIGPLFSMVLLGTLAIVVSSIRAYQESIAELGQDRARLRLASINLKTEIDKTHTELQTTIFGILSPAIQELERRLEAIKDSKSLSSAVEALKVTVEDVVRPLSHKVGQTNFEQLVLETAQTIKADSRQQRYNLSVTLRPTWSAMIATMIGIGPALVSESTNNGVVVVTVLAVVVYGVLSAIKLLTENRPMKIWLVGLITTGAYSASAGLFILVSGFFDANPTPIEQSQILVLITLLGVVMFIFEWSAAYSARNVESARAVNERFEILNSRLRRQVWLDHRRMASILHGQLQGALYAAAIRLNQSGEPNDFLIENVKSEIQQAVSELTRDFKQDHRFDVVLGQLFEMWEDIVLFETSFEVGAMDALNKSSEAAECAIEVIREGINNAVKHGGADKITIKIRQLSAQLVEIRIINTGKKLEGQQVPGFGTTMIDEYTHRWWRKTTAKGVELGAQVLI